MKRVHPSGAQKRNLLNKQQQKHDEVVKKTPKLTTFFKPEASETAVNVDSDDPNTHDSIDSDQLDVSESETSDKSEFGDNTENDPAEWGDMYEADIKYWLKNGPDACQNHDGPFDKSARSYPGKTRKCTTALFTRTTPNGNTSKREWLLYSKSTGSVYCFVCKLFSTNTESTKLTSAAGFSDWKNN